MLESDNIQGHLFRMIFKLSELPEPHLRYAEKYLGRPMFLAFVAMRSPFFSVQMLLIYFTRFSFTWFSFFGLILAELVT
jgi:hypothetical protein